MIDEKEVLQTCHHKKNVGGHKTLTGKKKDQQGGTSKK